MPRKPWKTRPTNPTVSENLRRYLETGERERGDRETFLLAGNPDRLGKLWRKVKHEIMRVWIERKPCSRPAAWWKCDAPKRDTGTGAWFEPLPEPRRQVGGVGRTTVEVYPSVVPKFNRAIPEFAEVDEDDLPCFESEARYLERHNLLTPGERTWLGQHPEALEPERVLFDEE